MEKKIGYCPSVSPCKCGALPRIYQEGIAKKDIETKEMYFIETFEYSVECEECGASVYTRELDDAVYVWNEKMSA